MHHTTEEIYASVATSEIVSDSCNEFTVEALVNCG
jgi:hypothetical protein